MRRKTAVVMAAGKGTRMRSELPKVLVQVRGRPMVEYVLDALAAAGIDRTIVVVGHAAELVRRGLSHRPEVEFAHQKEPLGTGHAVMACREHLVRELGPVFVVAGDMPMIQSDSVAALLGEYERNPAACIFGTVHTENPHGLGRIVRDAQGRFSAIVEEKDATDQQRQITEVNMSYYVFRAPDLLAALTRIRPENAKQEYYLTDCPGLMKASGQVVRALPILKQVEALAVNNRRELAAVESAFARSA